jgi:capsular polysaccharide biosynthesis protein
MAPEPRTLGDALRHHWLLVAICTVLGVAVGVAAGLSRSPVYSSSTGLTIGQLNLSVQSIPGFATGGQALADSLSRSITAPQIIDPAAKKLNIAPSYVASHVSASPVSRTSTFLVYASGGSPQEAIDMANTVAESMLSYSQRTQDNPQTSRRLLAEFQSASRDQARAQRALDRITTAEDESTTGASASHDSSYAQAKAKLEELQLRTRVAGQAYSNSEQAVAAGAVIERLAPARAATDDKSSRIQLFGVIGAIAGALLGAALAVLRTARSARRRGAATA